MIPEMIYLMDVRLLGSNASSCTYYTGPTAGCPPLPKLGDQVDCGTVAGTVTSLNHERENFPGYVVYHLDIFTDLSERDEESNAFDERLNLSRNATKIKALFSSFW